MPEWEKEVLSYETSQTCSCVGGSLDFTGVSDTSKVEKGGTALYQHRCESCGNVEVFDKKYPFISFR